jgi:hypothetical protein
LKKKITPTLKSLKNGIINEMRQKKITGLSGGEEEKAHLSGFKVFNNLSLTPMPRQEKSSFAILI